MAHTHSTPNPRKSSWVQHLRHWLRHPTAEVVPPIFGDAEPPELRAFQAKMEEVRHEVEEVPGRPALHGGRSKPARRK